MHVIQIELKTRQARIVVGLIGWALVVAALLLLNLMQSPPPSKPQTVTITA